LYARFKLPDSDISSIRPAADYFEDDVFAAALFAASKIL
jgi:hypothetical protein